MQVIYIKFYQCTENSYCFHVVKLAVEGDVLETYIKCSFTLQLWSLIHDIHTLVSSIVKANDANQLKFTLLSSISNSILQGTWKLTSSISSSSMKCSLTGSHSRMRL